MHTHPNPDQDLPAAADARELGGLKYRVLAAPEGLPVTLAQAKLRLRIDGTLDDTDLDAMLQPATELVERMAEVTLVSRTYRMSLDRFPSRSAQAIRLPMPPAVSLAAITYVNDAGQTVSTSLLDWQLDSFASPGELLPAPGKTWPSVQAGRRNAVTIDWTAGFGAAANILPAAPAAVQAILMIVAQWYDNRQAWADGGVLNPTVETGVRTVLRGLWHGRLQ